MVNLRRACRELFRRGPDEMFDSLEQLHDHCRRQQQQSVDRWHQPQMLRPAENANSNLLQLEIGDDGAFEMNDWSFSQLCRLAGVNKDTVNRLSPATAGQVFRETLPSGKKPLKILTEGDRIRSIHGTQYTRLWNEDLVTTIMEHATGFQAPHKGFNGGTGLYAGEQNLISNRIGRCCKCLVVMYVQRLDGLACTHFKHRLDESRRTISSILHSTRRSVSSRNGVMGPFRSARFLMA